MENRPAPLFLSAESRLLPGLRRVVRVANPAAGQEWAAGPPGGRLWRPLLGSYTFTAGAGVANRQLGWLLQIADGPIGAVLNTNVITAGQSVLVTGPGGPMTQVGNTAGGVLATEMPSVWLPPGSTIGSRSLNLQAADQYSAILLFVEEAFISEADLLLDFEHGFTTELDVLLAHHLKPEREPHAAHKPVQPGR